MSTAPGPATHSGLAAAIAVVLTPLIVWLLLAHDAVLFGWILGTAGLCFGAAMLGEWKRARDRQGAAESESDPSDPRPLT